MCPIKALHYSLCVSATHTLHTGKCIILLAHVTEAQRPHREEYTAMFMCALLPHKQSLVKCGVFGTEYTLMNNIKFTKQPCQVSHTFHHSLCRHHRILMRSYDPITCQVRSSPPVNLDA